MQKTLDQMVLEEKRDYFRKWRAENRDKVKKYNEAYWEKKVTRKLKISQSEGCD